MQKRSCFSRNTNKSSSHRFSKHKEPPRIAPSLHRSARCRETASLQHYLRPLLNLRKPRHQPFLWPKHSPSPLRSRFSNHYRAQIPRQPYKCNLCQLMRHHSKIEATPKIKWTGALTTEIKGQDIRKKSSSVLS